MTRTELVQRLQNVIEMDLPEALPGPWEPYRDPHYSSHPREWVEGYRMAFQDMLYAIKREGLDP